MKDNSILMPIEQEILNEMGKNLKLARLRRRLSMEIICERANISRSTLWQIEKGNPSVSVGNYIAVAHAIGGFEKDFLKIAEDDKLGKTLLDLGVITKNRGSSK